MAEVRDEKPIPRATYRLKLNKDFGFDHAAEVAPYLARLGVSHVYCSPYLRARPGSTHGYDIVSHTELNHELGDRASFDRMTAAFRENGLGHILDFVPNHMGVGGADNPWWLDVLEWGPESEFSGWFDIDWRPDQSYLRGKVLVPFLGEQYGVVLQSGALQLKFDGATGSFAVWAYETHKLPICPFDYLILLAGSHPAIARLGDAFAHLSMWKPHIANRALELKEQLAALVREDPDASAAIKASVDRFNGKAGNLQSWSQLDGLIKHQHWRVAHFRVAADDINYRRFFNINELAGVRMELPELFDRAHSLIFQLMNEGVLDGVRLDHVDGLLDVKKYCLQLRAKAPRPFYLIVEKILAAHENLRDDWGVEGTTGYEFANLVSGLLIDPAGEEEITRIYAEFTGENESFDEIVRSCKMRIMENEMAGELNVLAREAAEVARSNPLTADFTKNVLQRALKEIIAAFPVYRTYVDEPNLASQADRRDIDWAVTRARRYDTYLDPSVFDFLHQILTCDLVAEPQSGFSRIATVRVAMRVQQYSGPVMAKGLEDTAFYRYNRLIALNEVGGHPDQFSVSVSAFHSANLHRSRRTPHALLSTSTHDTKRGEDARARLAAIAEVPMEWAEQLRLWSRLLRARSASSVENSPPSPNDEYLFYQMLIGAWPAELTELDGAQEQLAQLQTRIEAAMIKSLREAKVHTTWAAPSAWYEDGVLDFIRYSLDTSRSNLFLTSFLDFQRRVAALGARNSLIQIVMKLTAPGVPDIYQGAELWDLSMVDPDNRRPVDYQRRRYLLEAKETCRGELTGLMEHWTDGRIKLCLIHDLLAYRRREPMLFSMGSYQPLEADGPQSARICAYMRRYGDSVLVVATQLAGAGPTGGQDTVVQLPDAGQRPGWKNLLTGEEHAAMPTVTARELFSGCPVAVLVPRSQTREPGKALH